MPVFYMVTGRSTEIHLKCINYINISYFKWEKYLQQNNKVWLGAQPSMPTIKDMGWYVEKRLDNYIKSISYLYINVTV